MVAENFPGWDRTNGLAIFPSNLVLHHEGGPALPLSYRKVELSIGIEPIIKSFADSSLANWVTKQKVAGS